MAVFGDFQRHLRRGEKATLLCLACDRHQARIVHGYIRSYFEEVPLLAPLASRIGYDTIELTNGVEIVVATNSFRAIRGRTVALAILDECAYWRSDESANPDMEVYSALVPALATLRAAGSMIIGISSVYRRSGLLFNKWLAHHGKIDGGVLVIRQPSRVYNPNLDEPVLAGEIAADIALDPERSNAEWESQWRSDLADFVSRDVVERAVVEGRFELPKVGGVSYAAFTDPSGGSSDSFSLAIAHSDGDRGILDCIREVRPPFSPEKVVREFAGLLKSYDIYRVTGDRYGGEWVAERFKEHGVDYIPSEKVKSDIYRELLPSLNSGKVELLDNYRQTAQLCSLERRVGRGGRDSITHPSGGHDDVANAVAGAIVLVCGEGNTAALFDMWRRLGGLPEPEAVPAPRAPQPVAAEVFPEAGKILVDLPRSMNVTLPGPSIMRGGETVNLPGRTVSLSAGRQNVEPEIGNHSYLRPFIVH